MYFTLNWGRRQSHSYPTFTDILFLPTDSEEPNSVAGWCWGAVTLTALPSSSGRTNVPQAYSMFRWADNIFKCIFKGKKNHFLLLLPLQWFAFNHVICSEISNNIKGKQMVWDGCGFFFFFFLKTGRFWNVRISCQRTWKQRKCWGTLSKRAQTKIIERS